MISEDALIHMCAWDERLTQIMQCDEPDDRLIIIIDVAPTFSPRFSASAGWTPNATMSMPIKDNIDLVITTSLTVVIGLMFDGPTL